MIKEIEIKVKKLNNNAQLPSSGTPYAAGMDFYSTITRIIHPGETIAISTGIAVEIPIGKVLHIWDRSGMGFKGIKIHGGVVDSDYRGEVKAILHNSSQKAHEIKKGDRVCQGVIIDYYKPIITQVNNLEDSERGENWNSSTGR